MISYYSNNSLILKQLFNAARLQQTWTKPILPAIVNNKCYSTQQSEKINIPKAIPRGPTDILEALASTIKRDPTAAHYKFQDDPFLIPTSNFAKRSYALAQEAGRKAAKWIKEEHSDLFNHRHADPFIEAFAPAEKLTETTPITEDLLRKYINSAQISNAITIYGKMDSSTITTETKQSLLELVSFYNEEDQLSEELIEERWFKAGMKGKDQAKRTWKNNGLAEKIFLSFEKKTPEAYCALICGMAKYGQAEGALEYYNQMTAEGFTPDLNTYNSLLRVSGIAKEDGEQKIRFIEETLHNMAHVGIKPNVGTLNAILESISRIPIYRLARERALQVLADFKTIQVNPSLGSYFYLLKIFCREKGPVNNILIDIVSQLEKEMPPLQDLQDVAFFSEAMRICNSHLDDVLLARRLNDILSTPPNQVLIGDSFKESIYYRHFMLLLARAETPETFMEMYRHLVPHIYAPEQNVFETVLQTMVESSSAQYIPELWSDAVYMELADRESVIELVLQALANGSGPSSQLVVDKDDVDPVLTTARAVVTYVDAVIKSAEEKDRPVSLRWSGTMLGNLTKVFLQYQDVESANQMIIKVNTSKNQLSSFFPVATLSKFIDTCIERKDAAMALMALDYAAEMGYEEANAMGQRLSEHLQLDDRQKQKLESILGNSPSQSSK